MIENQNISNDITVEEKDGGENTVYELSPEDLRATVAMQTTKELQLRADELIQADTCVCCPERAEHWFKLTVHQTADYSFTANTHARVGARLYNRDGELLAADNVDGESNIFLINYPLLQGLVYYLRITPTYNYFTRFSTIITGTFTPVESVSISADTVTLIPNETVTLSATVLPENATMKTLVWSSSDDNIAEVDDFSGVVTAVSQGTTIVFARTLDGSNKRVECEVTVKKSTPGLKTVKSCRVRKEMSMNDSAILRDSTGAEVRLQVGDTVSLLSTSKITANDRIWYRILYKGMMMHVTADDESFEEIDVLLPEEPNGRSVKVNTGDGLPLRLRCVPNTNNESTIIGRFADGTTIMITNETPQNDIWYAVYGQTTDGISSYGWCSGEYLDFNQSTDDLQEEKVKALITTKICRVRSTPKIDSSNILKKSDASEVRLQINDTVRLLQETKIYGGQYSSNNSTRDDWYKIEYNGEAAYVTADSFKTFDLWHYKPESSSVYNISQNGITMLKSWEKFEESAYIASQQETKYTIGYGHVIQDGTTAVVINGESYTVLNREQASVLLMNDLNERFIPKFNSFLRLHSIKLNQKQYDACILDCFQRGENIWKNQVQKIAKFIKENKDFDDYEKVFNAFQGAGSDAGRNDRRAKEADLFVYGVYNVKEENL